MEKSSLQRLVHLDEVTSAFALGPMHVTTLSDRCYEQLRDAIITLELRPGTPLSELHLANHFGISKSPVREALQRLARDGLVMLETNRRCVVTGLEVQSVREWYELRLMLEPASFQRIVEFITPQTLDFLHQINQSAIEAVERQAPLEFIRNSDLFHLTLIELNPNRSLVAVVHDLFNKIRRVRIAQYREDTMRRQKSITLEGLQRHQEITLQMQDGKFERVGELLEHDIRRFIELLDDGHLSEALARVAYK